MSEHNEHGRHVEATDPAGPLDAADTVAPDEVIDTAAPVGPVAAELVPDVEDRLDPAALGLDLPTDPAEAEQVLLRELQAARGEAGAYLDDLRRVAADFDNYRKRTMREQASMVERAAERVLGGLLPALDSFDAALGIEPETPTEHKLLEGVRGTFNQLLDIVGKEGLGVIQTVGEPFDPALHEAVSAPSTGSGSLVVTQELRRGYTLHGRVIRAALVAVDHAREPVEADIAEDER